MSVHGKQDGKTNAAASLNHQADLSDSELDAVVGGHGLSLSGFKKGFDSIEAAPHDVANEAFQALHDAQNAASGIETTSKHGIADAGPGLQSQIDMAKHCMENQAAGIETTSKHGITDAGHRLKSQIDTAKHYMENQAAEAEFSKLLPEDKLKHLGKDLSNGLHENEHGLKDLGKDFAKGLHENEHGFKDLEKDLAKGPHSIEAILARQNQLSSEATQLANEATQLAISSLNSEAQKAEHAMSNVANEAGNAIKSLF